MSRLRRYVSVTTALIALLLLGYVVAVAARTLPGGPGEEPLWEFDGALDIDLGSLVGWSVFILAILGAVLLVFGVKEAKPRREERSRNYLGLILGVIVFFLILRFARPVADNLLGNASPSDAADPAGDGAGAGGGASIWLFSLLIAAVFAAALTRVGMTIRESNASFDRPLPDEVGPTESVHPVAPARSIKLGSDPRSRVLQSYHRFEEAAASKGIARRGNETAGRHAGRVESEAGIAHERLAELMRRYASSRFGSRDVDEVDADIAERASDELRRELEQ
jgi:hypothetical protein